MVAGTIFIIFNLLVFGLFLDSFVKLVYPDKDPVYVLNSALIYVFVFDLFFRSVVQRLPKVDFIPYLILPVKKTLISRFLISKSFLSFLNLYLLLIFVPFLVKTVLLNYDTVSLITYCAGFILMVVINQLLINILHCLIQNRFYLIFFPSVFILILFIVIFYFSWPAGDKTAVIGTAFLEGNIYVFAMQILIILFLYLLNITAFKILISGETDFRNIIREGRKNNRGPGYLAGRGIIGEYMKLELSMILRNKRTRQNTYYSIFFAVYALLFMFFNEISLDSIYVTQTVFLIVTGIFALFHGQFLLSWESSFSDFIHTYNIALSDFLKANFYLFVISNFLSGIIFLPVVIIMKTDIYLYISILVFNAGVTNFLIIYNSVLNSGKIDLTRKAYMNWQGTSLNQFLLIIAIVTVPSGISFIIRKLLPGFSIYPALIFAGVIVVVFHNKWIDLATIKLRKRKYSNLENYRN